MKNKITRLFTCVKFNYYLIAILLLTVNLIAVSKISAQLLSYTNATNGALVSTATHTAGAALVRVNGANTPGSPCSTGFSSSNFLATTSYSNTLSAVETSVKPDSGYILNVTGFAATLRRSSTGPAKVRFAYSIDGGTTWVAQSINQVVPNVSCSGGSALSWALNTSFTTTSMLKFRIYGFNATSTSGNEQIKNLMINGAVIPITANCGVPTNLFTTGITSSSAILNWNNVTGAINYKLQYRAIGATTWTTLTASTNSKIASGLAAASLYQYHVKTTCAVGSSAYSPISTFTTANIVPLPVPDHIVVFILENHSYTSIIGSPAAPYINALSIDTNAALFTQSFAIEHPSQPNYIDLFSGSNQGVTDDNVPANIPFTTPNLARALLDVSHSFITYSEDLPGIGYDGATSGAYARKHNPVANWMGTGVNQVPVTTNQPFTSFPAPGNYDSLPTVSFVVPNQDNDMHNGSDPARITVADNWMFNNLNSYIQWANTHNSLFILTFDEDDQSQSNRIVTIFAGPMVQPGLYVNHINHYNILRTIEDMYGLPYAGNASTLIDYCWKANAPKISNNTTSKKNLLTVFPNPASSCINFSLDKTPSSPLQITIKDEAGQNKGQYEIAGSQSKMISTKSFAQGNYFYTVIQNAEIIETGKFIIQH